jgi:hypothetical protein
LAYLAAQEERERAWIIEAAVVEGSGEKEEQEKQHQNCPSFDSSPDASSSFPPSASSRVHLSAEVLWRDGATAATTKKQQTQHQTQQRTQQQHQQQHQPRPRRTVYMDGVFDLFHVGHLEVLVCRGCSWCLGCVVVLLCCAVSVDAVPFLLFCA